MTRESLISCPEPEELERLLLGLVPLSEDEAAALEQHLTNCTYCDRLAQVRVSDDRLLASMQHQAATERAETARITGLLEKLKRLQPAHPTPVLAASDAATQPESADYGGSGEPYTFLAPPQWPDEIGRLGPYRVLQALGVGGMGIVFLAEDMHLQRRVALKVMKPSVSDSPAARERFLREARAMAAVKNDHIVTVYQVGEDRGAPFLAMELLQGESLEQYLARSRHADVAEVLRVGRQVAAGLQAAHDKGLIHRDIKPSNIWLEAGTGRAKILDFGLVRVADDASLSQYGILAGTPQFMSPEQADGRLVDHRSDLFSLGSVLYALCTGQPPFGGGSTLSILKHVCHDRSRPIRETNPEIPDRLCDLIARLHAKDPAQRLPSAAAVAELLAECSAQMEQPSVVPRRALLGPLIVGRSVQWVAVILLSLLTALALTEFAGKTSLVANILRALTPDGPRANRDVELVEKDQVTIAGDSKELVEPTRATRGSLFGEGPVGEVRRLEGYTGAILSLTFSADGRHALFSDGKAEIHPGYSVRLVDLETRRELGCFRGHTSPVQAVAFAPDRKHALSAGEAVWVWNLETGQDVRAFGRHPRGASSAAFSADGRRALTGDQEGRVWLWDVDSGKELRCFTGPTDVVWSVAVSPDGSRVLAGCGGNHIDGRYVPPSGKTLHAWDAHSGTEMHGFGSNSDHIGSVAFSPDGRYALSGGADRKVRLWAVEDGSLLNSFEGHTDTVNSVAFSPDGRRALSAASDEPNRGDGSVRLWDVQTGVELQRFLAHRGGVSRVVFSPDGRFALSGGIVDGTVRLWRLPPDSGLVPTIAPRPTNR